jgi:hypothetical protein
MMLVRRGGRQAVASEVYRFSNTPSTRIAAMFPGLVIVVNQRESRCTLPSSALSMDRISPLVLVLSLVNCLHGVFSIGKWVSGQMIHGIGRRLFDTRD